MNARETAEAELTALLRTLEVGQRAYVGEKIVLEVMGCPGVSQALEYLAELALQAGITPRVSHSILRGQFLITRISREAAH